MLSDEKLIAKYHLLLPKLSENICRIYLASEALALGRGGKSKIAKLTNVSRTRIDKGIAELNSLKAENLNGGIRKAGGGRKQITVDNMALLNSLEELVCPHTRGDPMNPLLWTSKSLRNLSKSLNEQGFKISYVTVGELLKSLGYSLQANKKTDEGAKEEDRNEQFEHINATTISFMKENNPVISVDCKKKELIGNYKNSGREWEVKKQALEVKVYDFVDKELGKAVPYGIYDIAKNEGFVNVGISSDTAEFAVNSIRTWWKEMGQEQYNASKKIYITADGGGSNSSRGRLWKTELQKLSTETGLEITVSHFPPGTSKWNKIEHRLFSYISKNWRAKPLTSIEVVVNLIANTTTEKGLTVKAKKDQNEYKTGKKISDIELEKVNINRFDFRGQWNYTIYPIM
jgi:transposase